MAEYTPEPQLIITNTFSDLVTKFNTVSSGIGATGDLNTAVKTSIVGAINSIEDVFDASEFEISAGSNAFDVTSGAFTIDASGTISLDAATSALTGDLTLVDNKEIQVGTGADLILLHDATHSIIKGDSIYIKAKSADENMASFTYNGAVNLYHDAASRLATTAGGVSIPDDLELGAASVIKSGGNAAITFANANVTMGGNISIAGTVDGRDVSVDGTKLDTVETNADVTDTANVTAAGALMDSELADSASVKALNQSLVSGATPTFGTANFTDATNKRFMTDAQETKLDSVEASADVTDTANVTSAGALMDSELASIEDVKALDQSVISGATPTFGTANFTDATNKRFMSDAQESKLDGIAAGAQVNRSAAATLNLIKGVDGAGSLLDADKLDGQEGSYYATAASVTTNTTAIGTLSSLSSAITNDGNLVLAINELQGDITQINENGASANNTLIGTLAQLLTNEDSDVVSAINELHGEIVTNTTKLSGIDSDADVTLSKISAGTNISISGSGVISSTDTNTTYTTATNNTLGLVKIGYSTTGKNYAVQLSNGQMYVNVPWDLDTDTNTQNTYNVSAQTTSGGANLRLGGSGPTATAADNVKLASGGATTVSQTDTSTITITSTNTNQLTTFQLEDGDGTEVTISHGKEVKFTEGQGINVNWTDTSTGSNADPYDMQFALKTNGVRANELNVSGLGTTTQFLRSDGDGSFTWAVPVDTNTTYTVGDGGLTQKNFTTALKSKLDGIESNLNAFVEPSQALTTTATTVATAINELKAAIPLVFNASGTQLN